jgi:biopolymer transport protein ExbD
MSHGTPGDSIRCEPNLTPLLDMVLQLLMFFMMCVNFVTEQVSEDIRLPRSQSVKPMDKADTDVLYINYKPFHEAEFERRLPPEKLDRVRAKFHEGDPCVLIVGEEPIKLIELKYKLKRMYEDAQKLAPDGKVNTAIVIRADRDADYVQVYEILHLCKVQGYTRLKFRGMQETKRGGT